MNNNDTMQMPFGGAAAAAAASLPHHRHVVPKMGGDIDWLPIVACIAGLFLLHHLRAVRSWHAVHKEDGGHKIPPAYPHVAPLLGTAIQFSLNGANFVKSATQYAGKLVPVKITIATEDIFLFQGPKNLAAVWKQPLLGSPIFIYAFALRNLFGMPKRALKTYLADNSGMHRRPHALSNVEPHNRVDYLTHMGLFKAFGGKGLNTAFDRCSSLLKRNIESVGIPSRQWLEQPDLYAFFQRHMSAAVIEALYSPALLKLNPTFIDDIWAFDRATPKFAKLVPKFLMPEAYRARSRLLESIKGWHEHARQNFEPSCIAADGDADPYWGSELVRSRQRILLQADNQDQDAIASADLGLIWVSVTNLVPSSMMCALHILRNRPLCDRLRTDLAEFVDPTTHEVNMDQALRSPLLASIYAETLRLHVQAYVTRCSSFSALEIGEWFLPRNKVVMVNTYPSHMDESFWNTRGGAHPLDTFWAERFLIDPTDPQSGPVRPDVSEDMYRRPSPPEGANPKQPFFSVEGLNGAWIPYGGGYAACPGRHFAKRILFWTISMLLSKYDIEVPDHNLEMDSSSFGLGTQKPKHAVPFRIRERANDEKMML